MSKSSGRQSSGLPSYAELAALYEETQGGGVNPDVLEEHSRLMGTYREDRVQKGLGDTALADDVYTNSIGRND